MPYNGGGSSFVEVGSMMMKGELNIRMEPAARNGGAQIRNELRRS